MAFKHYTDASTQNTVAINSSNVIYVREIASGGCFIYFVNGSDIKINEPYLEVIASLNSK